MDFSLSRVANAEGLFAPLDRAGVPNLADIYDQARMGTAPGGEWGPGIDFDNLVLLWGDTAAPPPKGIADLMNPANKGKIAFSPLPNVIGTAVQILTAKYLGLDYKGPDDPVIAALKKIGANVQTWQATPDNYTMIINGALGIGVGWNARAQFYADKSGGKVKSAAVHRGQHSRHGHHQPGRRQPQSGGGQGLHRLRALARAAGGAGQADVLRPDEPQRQAAARAGEPHFLGAADAGEDDPGGLGFRGQGARRLGRPAGAAR